MSDPVSIVTDALRASDYEWGDAARAMVVLTELVDAGWRIVREAEEDPHHVTFTGPGWAIEHSAACRNAGSMLDCPLDSELRELCTGPPPQGPGRYVVEHLEHGFDFHPAPDAPAATALLFTEEWKP